VYPSQYNPVTGEVRYFKSLTVEVELKQIERSADAPAYNCTRAMKSLLQHTVDNPEALSDLPYVKKDADDYEYLIITSDFLKGAFGDLIAFNKRRGMRTKLTTIEEIRASTSGPTDVEKMRNYIIQQYNDHRIVYVLLGGDHSTSSSDPYHVPAPVNFGCIYYDHHVAPDRYHDVSNACSDIFFSTLDGTWKNSPSDDRYGKYPGGDWFWDVYASRWVVDNAEKVATHIRKLVSYSENPVRDQIKNALLAGEVLWDWTGNPGEKIWGSMFLSELYGDGSYSGSSYTDYQGHEYTTYRTPTPPWKIDSLYERSLGSWNSNDLKYKIEQVKPSWIETSGHGSPSSAFKVSTQSNLDDIFAGNNGTTANFTILTSQACSPSAFQEYYSCIMEECMNSANGPVITWGSTMSGQLDDDGTDGSGNRPFRWLHDALYNPAKRVHYWGMMDALSKEVDADIVTTEGIDVYPYLNCLRFLHFIIVTMGDPALSVWTETPKDLTDLFPYTAAKDKFTMKTPPYSWVALADNTTGEIITTQLTGYVYDAENSFIVADSACEIDDQPYKDYTQNNNKVTVIVKAHNYIAYTKKDVPITGTGIIDNNTALTDNSFFISSHNGQVRVNFTMARNARVNLSIYNSKGALVNTVVNSMMQSGKQHIAIDNSKFGNGIYYCRIKTGNSSSIRKFIIAR
jgi:hypothetical protein